MSEWYVYRPIDTLYFRDARPMMIGEDHTAGLIFPPMPQTISGALRTYLYQEKGFNNQELNEKIGAPGKKASFDLFGPLFEEGENLYLPLPYFAYAKKEELKRKMRDDDVFEINVYKAKQLREIAESKEIRTPHFDKLLWVKSSEEMMPIGGSFWIQALDWEKLIRDSDLLSLKIYPSSYFYTTESRVGIARNKDRTVREGHLYTFTHVRLKREVRLCFGIDKDIGLPQSFSMSLGAEQRFGEVRKISPHFTLSSEKGNVSVLLGAVPYQENMDVVVTGKLKAVGGWDMHRKFHKTMQMFLPAGTVLRGNAVNSISLNFNFKEN